MKARITSLVVSVLLAGLLPGCAFVSRATETSAGVPADGSSGNPALSADGHWLAFASNATNLVPGDTNGTTDAFVRDNWTKNVTRVSVTSAGSETAGGAFGSVSISDDGRVVAFGSDASDLAPGDTNGEFDVYWHDRDADQDGIFDEPGAIRTVLASATPGNVAGNGFSYQPSVSGSGTVVAFTSVANDLLGTADHDENGVDDVFATTFDLATGNRIRMRIVSRSIAQPAIEANGHSTNPSVDSTGSVVAFATSATNLLANDTNGVVDVVVNTGLQLQRGTGATVANGPNYSPVLSRNSNFVAYISDATNLVAGDTTPSHAVFVTDFALTGTTESVSEDYRIAPSHPHEVWNRVLPSISSNGSRVAFISLDPELVPGDTNNTWDAFVHDVATGITQRVSTDSALRERPSGAMEVALSADGRFVATYSPFTRGSTADIFVRTTFVPVVNSVAAVVDPVAHVEGPPVLRPGSNRLIVHGALFAPDATASLGNGITASVVGVTASAATFDVNVAPTTPAGERSLVVGNPGGPGALQGGALQYCHQCVTIAP